MNNPKPWQLMQPWTLDDDINAFMDAFELPPPDVMETYEGERNRLEATAPKVGDTAPDFHVTALNDHRTITLADYQGRPLALLFGSYTCPIYRGQIDRFNSIYRHYKDDYAFLTIYVREAHAEDEWRLNINTKQDVVFQQPTTLEARAEIAKICHERMQITMPVALDNMNDDAGRAYVAWPERLYIMTADGAIAYRSAPGPFPMAEIDQWENALKAQKD